MKGCKIMDKEWELLYKEACRLQGEKKISKTEIFIWESVWQIHVQLVCVLKEMLLGQC